MPRIDDKWDYGYIRKDAKGRKVHIIRVSIGGKRYEVSTRRHTQGAAIDEYRRFETDPENYEPVMQRRSQTGSGSLPSTRIKMYERDHRQRIDIGPKMSQVSPVAYWYRCGHFKNEEQANGAFELAYQQAMDGMGASASGWMGLTEEEFDAWMRNRALPIKRK
jgi:hypothetical protein